MIINQILIIKSLIIEQYTKNLKKNLLNSLVKSHSIIAKVQIMKIFRNPQLLNQKLVEPSALLIIIFRKLKYNQK